jgi:hypothetical protein
MMLAVAAAAAKAAFIVVELPSSCPHDVPLILWSISDRKCSTVGAVMI